MVVSVFSFHIKIISAAVTQTQAIYGNTKDVDQAPGTLGAISRAVTDLFSEWVVEAYVMVGPTKRRRLGTSEVGSSRKVGCLM